jgi:hypothetical protein
MMKPQQLLIVYGGELARDVAEQIAAKKPTQNCPIDNVIMRSGSERPKTLLDLNSDTLVCFVMQTIENQSPTEDVSD